MEESEAGDLCGEFDAGCVEPESCAGRDVDLSLLDGNERARALAALTARFSATYLRWMRTQRGDPLTYSGARVVEALSSGTPVIMRDIAGALGVTARNMTAIVDTLEESGLVLRVPHPHDRRAIMVELTEEGRREADRRRGQAAIQAAAFDSLSAEEQQQYADLLSRLLARFTC